MCQQMTSKSLNTKPSVMDQHDNQCLHIVLPNMSLLSSSYKSAQSNQLKPPTKGLGLSNMS